MISSFTVPTVSAKYPSAQKLSPQRNSSSSGYSFLITLLVPPLRIFTASATLSDALSWMIRWIWSSCTLSSLIHHLFILQASYSSRFRRPEILPLNTLLRYFGIHTKWYSNRCLVCDPVRYLAIARLCQIYLRDASCTGFAPGGHSSPSLKTRGFLASFIKRIFSSKFPLWWVRFL